MIVTTLGVVELIDGAANKFAVVDPKGEVRAVIGLNWIAWQTLDDKKNQLQLETVGEAMKYAKASK